MTAIAMMSLRRMLEAPSVMLFLMGGAIAYIVCDAPVFDLVNLGGDADSKGGALLGTVLLVGLGVLVTVFNAASDIPRDISSRFIAVLLSKPLSRFEYLMGKYLGMLIQGLISAIVWLIVLLYFRSGDVSFSMIIDQFVVLLVFLPATAIAIMVSCFLQDIVSMVVTFVLLLFAVVNGIIPVVLSISPEYLQKFILTIYYIFPNFLFYVQSYDSFWGIGGIVLYSVALSAVFLHFAQLIFDSGDIF